MKNLIIGIIIGIVLVIATRIVYADSQSGYWNLGQPTGDFDDATIQRFTDGPHINCYVSRINSSTYTSPTISCVYIK